MATERQKRFIFALMCELGHVHPRYRSLRGSSKHLPYGPSMRERGGSGSFDAWVSRLTVRQASEVIQYLLAEKNGK